MGSYGNNIEFRVPPQGGQREGRFATHADQPAIPIGAPVLLDVAAAPNSMNLPLVQLATGPQSPAGGNRGLAVFEYGPAAFAGDDPYLTTYSQKSVVPPGAALQVVHGIDVKVVFRNTVTGQMLGIGPSRPGRLMVAPAGLAGLAIGDLLTPGAGTDAGGYWAETAIAADAWLVVTSVDTLRGEVEARMLF